MRRSDWSLPLVAPEVALTGSRSRGCPRFTRPLVESLAPAKAAVLISMLVERSGKAPKGTLPSWLLALLALLAFTPCLSLRLATWCKSEQPGPLSSSSSMAAALLLLIRLPALAACSKPHPDVAPSTLRGLFFNLLLNLASMCSTALRC